MKKMKIGDGRGERVLGACAGREGELVRVGDEDVRRAGDRLVDLVRAATRQEVDVVEEVEVEREGRDQERRGRDEQQRERDAAEDLPAAPRRRRAQPRSAPPGPPAAPRCRRGTSTGSRSRCSRGGTRPSPTSGRRATGCSSRGAWLTAPNSSFRSPRQTSTARNAGTAKAARAARAGVRMSLRPGLFSVIARNSPIANWMSTERSAYANVQAKTRRNGSRTSGSVRIVLKFCEADVRLPAGLECLAGRGHVRALAVVRVHRARLDALERVRLRVVDEGRLQLDREAQALRPHERALLGRDDERRERARRSRRGRRPARARSPRPR